MVTTRHYCVFIVFYGVLFIVLYGVLWFCLCFMVFYYVF